MRPRRAVLVPKTTHDAPDGLSASCVAAGTALNAALPQILQVDTPALPILPLLIEGVRLAVAVRAIEAEVHRQAPNHGDVPARVRRNRVQNAVLVREIPRVV